MFQNSFNEVGIKVIHKINKDYTHPHTQPTTFQKFNRGIANSILGYMKINSQLIVKQQPVKTHNRRKNPLFSITTQKIKKYKRKRVRSL